jgi:hypothetical protein
MSGPRMPKRPGRRHVVGSQLPADTDPKLANLTIDDVVAYNEHHGGAVTINYKGWAIVAPRVDVENAIAFIRDGMKPSERAHYVAVVRKAVNKVWPKVVSQRATTEQAVDCAQDIAILHAYDVFRGEATLPPLVPGTGT